MADDAASLYELQRTIYRLTERCARDATQALCAGPLTEMQSIALRVALGALVREAVGVGRWHERRVRTAYVVGEPRPDGDDEVTEPSRPRR